MPRSCFNLFVALFLLMELISCAEIEGVKGLDTETQSTAPIFPHPDAWGTKASHGLYVINNGKAGCAGCHGSSYQGNGTEASACSTCHDPYPHTSGWATITGHGAYALNNDINSNCATECHGTDYAGTEGVPACSSCHSLFPHDAFRANWVSYTVHGTYVLTNGTSSCATECHGTDLGGGHSGTACSSCHNYPHPEAWPTDHQNFGGTGGTVSIDPSCQTVEGCHNTAPRGPALGFTCTSFCHQ